MWRRSAACGLCETSRVDGESNGDEGRSKTQVENAFTATARRLQSYPQGHRQTVSQSFSLVIVSMLNYFCRFDNSSSVGVIFGSFDRGCTICIRDVGGVVVLFQSLTLTLLLVALVNCAYFEGLL
jgi:hypothetical protein